jgi:hypothetical protein
MTADIIRRHFTVRGIPESQGLSEISLIWEMSIYESIQPAVAFQYQLLAVRTAYDDFHICHLEESREGVAKPSIGEEGFNGGRLPSR